MKDCCGKIGDIIKIPLLKSPSDMLLDNDIFDFSFKHQNLSLWQKSCNQDRYCRPIVSLKRLFKYLINRMIISLKDLNSNYPECYLRNLRQTVTEMRSLILWPIKFELKLWLQEVVYEFRYIVINSPHKKRSVIGPSSGGAIKFYLTCYLPKNQFRDVGSKCM